MPDTLYPDMAKKNSLLVVVSLLVCLGLSLSAWLFLHVHTTNNHNHEDGYLNQEHNYREQIEFMKADFEKRLSAFVVATEKLVQDTKKDCLNKSKNKVQEIHLLQVDNQMDNQANKEMGDVEKLQMEMETVGEEEEDLQAPALEEVIESKEMGKKVSVKSLESSNKRRGPKPLSKKLEEWHARDRDWVQRGAIMSLLSMKCIDSGNGNWNWEVKV